MANGKMMGIIFSSTHDEVLRELTEKRAIASVPFAGRYRLIDFTLSGMVQAGITEVGVVTKEKYHSLMDHLGAGRPWDLDRKRDGLYILPPLGFRGGGEGVYQTNLEALYAIEGSLLHSKAEYVLLADANLIYNMDYTELLEYHESKNADITLLSCKYNFVKEKYPDNENIMLFNQRAGRVSDIMFSPSDNPPSNLYLGVMLISRKLLINIIDRAKSANLSNLKRDILQRNPFDLNIVTYNYKGFVRPIYSLKDYFNASMEMLNPKIKNELFQKDRQVLTKVRDEAPAKYGLEAKVVNSLIADGAVIEGEVEDSIIFRGVKIGKGAKVKNCIVMQGTVIGKEAELGYVITDKDVEISDGRLMVGYESFPVYISKGSKV